MADDDIPPVPASLQLAMRALANFVLAPERAGPHVVIAFDPETREFTATGVYLNQEVATAKAAETSADFNRPQNNDGPEVLYFPVPLARDDGELQWVESEVRDEWQIQYRQGGTRRWHPLRVFDNEASARAYAWNYHDPGYEISVRIRKRRVEVRRGSWEVVR